MTKLLTIVPLLLAAALGSGSGHAADLAPLTFTTLAGLAGALVKSADGVGSAAEFNAPRGVAVDVAGNVYVADSSNHTVRKITPSGVVTTLAGLPGSQGRQDGTGAAARFIDPYALAVDPAGTVYVADTSNNMIRKITPAGVVSTLAGNGEQGSSDGVGAAARFREPRGIAVDGAGNVYVGDYGNETVRKITAAGVVSTLAGSAGVVGSSNGVGATASFKGLFGVAVDAAGNVFVADTANRVIRKITAAGVVSTFAGTVNSSGTADGAGSLARLAEPRGIAIDAAGTLYVADYGAHTLRKITPSGVVSTLAGAAPLSGSTDATGNAARFYYPSGVAADGAGNVYVADTSNNTVRKVSDASVVSTLAGLAGRSSSVDGTGSVARFEDPYAVAADGSGNLYLADPGDHTIRKVTPAGVVTTLAGSAGQYGGTDGVGAAARFKGPLGIAADAAGTLYVADTGNHVIRKISAGAVVTTLAGTVGAAGNNDGAGAAARFSEPNGVAVDSAGRVYVADTSNGTIRVITPTGVVSTLAGTPGAPGLVDGVGSAARFQVPFDVAVDAAGNVYVSDHGNHVVRKITAAGVVTTLAGSGLAGNTDGIGAAASFRYPSGLAVDSAGNVLLADTDNHTLRHITPTGVVSTVGGAARVTGSTDGVGSAARFFNPKDVAVDATGKVYVADRGNHTVRLGSAAGAVTTDATADCLFNWAEVNLPQFVAPPATSLFSSPYRFRFYSTTQAYLAVSAADGHAYYYVAGKLVDLGLLVDVAPLAGCP